MKNALKIHVTGIVQGVGFRPFVYRQAQHYLISGWVYNSADGVHIHAEGDENMVDEFVMSLANEAPYAAKVEQVEMQEVPLKNYSKFEIRQSKNEKTSQKGELSGQTLISPDLATCGDCVEEMSNASHRKYRYPFINCTNCGPRFTIIGKLPYDRCYTSMSSFDMCEACNGEYNDPMDRRFHAQPNACFECGPYINWCEKDDEQRSTGAVIMGACDSPFGSLLVGSNLKKSDEIISRCVDFLLKGKIVAIKGLGGFHLACDAANEKAVQELRRRKMRSNKAFAIMTSDLDSIEEICYVNKTEEDLLTGSVRPIVLLKRRNTSALAKDLAFNLPEIGVMLPYTPLQHILLNDYKKAGGKFLVMTSGNIYDNPIITDDDQARLVLADVADAVLGNNREILQRYDDSVVRVINAGDVEAVQMIRRARGYAPVPLRLCLDNKQEVFATGPEQKNTFAYLRNIAYSENEKTNIEVFVSQHIGDVENAEIFDVWENTKNQYKDIFKFNPRKVICDAHPEYLTTKWAENQNLPVEKVQHHFAHIRSVMYENGLVGPVCGFAFDGTGYGMDGNIWGGEVLLCNQKNFERFANFSYVPMPGGQTAVKDPLKMAFGVLWAFDLLEHPVAKKIFSAFNKDEQTNMLTMIEQGINCPLTSSVGRLFDAASAILGICTNPTYEGEAAISLEASLWESIDNIGSHEYDKSYEIQITKNIATKDSTAQDTSVLIFDPSTTFKALLDAIESNDNLANIVKNFHDAFVRVILNCSNMVKQIYGIKEIALSGGVFMNRYLIESSIKELVNQGFSVAINRDVPPNDGGISLGQL